MVLGGVWDESLRCGRRGKGRARVEKRRRSIAAIVAISVEVIGRRVEV